MSQSASVPFTIDELWMMRAYIRHEMPQQEGWKFPPASLSLNDQIANAILFCYENAQEEAALVLSRGDCLVIDFCVPQEAKSQRGVMLGAPVLLKSFVARRVIEDDGPYHFTVPEPAEQPSKEQIDAAVARADKLEQQRAKRAARRKAKE